MDYRKLAELYDRMMRHYREGKDHYFRLTAEKLIKEFETMSELPFDSESRAHYYMIEMYAACRVWQATGRPDCQCRKRLATYARMLAEENMPNPWAEYLDRADGQEDTTDEKEQERKW